MNKLFAELGIGLANPDYSGFIVAWILVLVLTIATIRWRTKTLKELNVLSWPDAFVKPRWRALKTFCQVAGFFFLVVALIGPQWGQKEKVVKAEGLDICFAIDLSRSMQAEDVVPSRLQAAKNQLTIFMQRMGGDRAALVGFAGSAFIAAPLTTDHRALVSFLDPMDPSYISDQSTNLSVGIDACLKALSLDKVKERAEIADLAAKVVVLVSDGEETGDDFQGAVKRAEALGVPVYAFAVGTAKGGLIPVRTDSGMRYLKDPDNPDANVVTKLEEKKIKEIAEKTGGKVFYLSGGVEVLKDFEAALTNYKRDSVDAGTRLDREDRFQWPLAVAFFLLFLDFLIPELGFAWKLFAQRKGSAALKAVAVSLVFAAAPRSEAEGLPSKLMPWTIFRSNRGTSQYQDKQLPESRQSFETALADDSRDLMLRYNWAATRLAMSAPQEKGQDFNQKILDEASGELKKILRESETKNPHDPFLKPLHYQLGLALELKKDKTGALQNYYRSLRIPPANPKLDTLTEEGIRRLLAAEQQNGGGGGQNQKQDDQKGEGDKDKKEQKFGQGPQKPAEFKGTDVNESQAKKILESVGSKEREVQKRRSQNEAKDKQRARGDDGPSNGRGKQW
jgi:Ca-activated chloride channel family protein